FSHDANTTQNPTLSLHDALPISTFQENEGVGVFLGLVQSGDPELVELIRNKLLRPRIEQAVQRLHAGVALGQVRPDADAQVATRSEEHTSELQSRFDLVCRLLLA